MEDLSVQVLQGFGVKAKRIVKEKSYYICSTDKGLRMINKSMETAAHIQFQHEVKEYLSQAGFPTTDRFYSAANGAVYVEHDDNLYVMTDYFNYRESDFTNNRDFERVVAGVARMHKALEGISFSVPPVYDGQNLTELVKKSMAEFSTIKRRIGSQKRLSDFDVLFIKNFDYYISQMKTSVDMLSRIDLCAYDEAVRQNNTVCHNLLKEEHLQYDANTLYITAFSQARIDSVVHDISSIIQRYAKSLPLRPLGINHILELYDRYNPLSRTDLDLLYALLKFPHKYVKICNQYYMKKRTWTPSAIINRVESIISNKEDYNDFIENRM